MRILFILHRYPAIGGIENVTSILANEFTLRYGYDVSIFSCIHQKNTNTRIPLHGNIFQAIAESNDITTIQLKFKEFLQRNSPFDIAIFQDSYAPIESILSFLPSSTKLIVVEHSTPDCQLKNYKHYRKRLSWKTPHGLAGRIAGIYKYPHILLQTIRRHKRLIERADHYIVLSPSFINIIRNRFNIKCGKITAIPNPNTIMPLQTEDILPPKNNILFVGRICKEKGIKHLMNIWALIEQKGTSDFNQLLIIGDGEELLSAKAQAKELGLKRIQFLGGKTNIEQYLQTGTCLLMTSIFEGFGLVLVEAMSYGCIPFAFDSFDSCHDIIENKKTGFIIPAFDEKTYAKEVMSFLQQPQTEQDKMRLAAIKKSQTYSIENISKQWEETITNIMQ